MLLTSKQKLVLKGVTFLVFIVIITVMIVYLKQQRNLDVVVRTDCGDLIGRERRVIPVNGEVTSCYEFTNIPYAVPPVGDLRWTPSKLLSEDPSKCWKGQYDSNDQTEKRCPQITYEKGRIEPVGDEDCLYLSVRSPNLGGSLPVLVWIHGGSLEAGHKDDVGYSPDSEFTAAMNVVAVNINYRLNLLGFLALESLWSKGKFLV